MLTIRSLFLLALPLLAASRAVELDPRLAGLPDLPSQIAYTPAEALEHSFKAVHDAHQARKEALRRRGDSDEGIPGVVTTRNELNEGKCADIIVIFARGTTEPGSFPRDGCCEGAADQRRKCW